MEMLPSPEFTGVSGRCNTTTLRPHDLCAEKSLISARRFARLLCRPTAIQRFKRREQADENSVATRPTAQWREQQAERVSGFLDYLIR
jgi:hypothetical protein